jgi:tyrosyl-tRNA synthetase
MASKKSTIDEILTRGVTDVIVRNDLENKLSRGPKLRIKLGIDPTGPKIHIGRAITLWKLKELQDLGHQIVMIIGDFTGQIGDASDKTAERQVISLDEIKKNMETYKAQIGKILDLKKVEFRYNSEWLGKLSAQDLVEEAMNFTVAQMIERDNFIDRFNAKKPIGLHEILYPIFQGYDSVAVKADVEIGGNDQLFNLLAGRVVQKKHDMAQQNVITFELLEGTDGRKMSTSYGNCIYIEDSATDMYGKVMSIKDELIVRYMTLCTDMPMTEVKEFEKTLKKERINPRDAKAVLAYEIVRRYHGLKEAKLAQENFQKTVVNKELPDAIPVIKMKKATIYLNELMVDAKLAPSKTEARRLIEQGGVKVEGAVIGDREAVIEGHSGMIIQVGKRKFVKIK